jgi:hypothetical protein
VLDTTAVTSIHDARKFRLDLIKELACRRSPRYPQREFWLALELADHADTPENAAALAKYAGTDWAYPSLNS